jgi:hypothetical protein
MSILCHYFEKNTKLLEKEINLCKPLTYEQRLELINIYEKCKLTYSPKFKINFQGAKCIKLMDYIEHKEYKPSPHGWIPEN